MERLIVKEDGIYLKVKGGMLYVSDQDKAAELVSQAMECKVECPKKTLCLYACDKSREDPKIGKSYSIKEIPKHVDVYQKKVDGIWIDTPFEMYRSQSKYKTFEVRHVVRFIEEKIVILSVRPLSDLQETEAFKLGVYGLWKAMHEWPSWDIQVYNFRDVAKLVKAGFDITSVLSEQDLNMVRASKENKENS